MVSPESRGAAGREEVETVALDQSFDADGLYALRSALLAHGSDLGAIEAELDRLVLIVSELATNAVRHGGGSGRVRMWRDGARVVCEVSDHGAGIGDADAGARSVEPTAMGGRGLWIARRLSDTMTIGTGSPGAVVTIELTVTNPPSV